MLAGLDGMKCLFYESSSISSQGLKWRGKLFKDVRWGGEVEGVFWHALTGDLLTQGEINELQTDLLRRQEIPQYIDAMLATMPQSINPVTALSVEVLGLQSGSKFAKKQLEGLEKKDQYKVTLEDALDLLAKLPELASKVYLHKYGQGKAPQSLKSWDRLAEVIGIEAATLKFIIGLRSEKEGGRIDAHLASCVNSTLADAYFSLSASINAFAGPRISSALSLSISQLSSLKPGSTRHQLAEQYVTSQSYRGIYPVSTHGSSKHDTRLQSLKEHVLSLPANQYLEHSFELCEALPLILPEDQALSLAFDTMTGAVLHTAGLKIPEFYPVLDALGSGVTSLANIVLNRVIVLPIEYPISTDLEGLEEIVRCKSSLA